MESLLLTNGELSRGRPKVLVVGEEKECSRISRMLSGECDLLRCGSIGEAVENIRAEGPPVVILLEPSPPEGQKGFEDLEELFRADPFIKVVVVVHNRDVEKKVVAMGAHDVFVHPLDVKEFRMAVKRAIHLYDLVSEIGDSERRRRETFCGIIGSSREMKEVFSVIDRVARTNVPVLITGESGAGKELVARAIHMLSDRKARPFIAINCGAIPEGLLESELFGHEKGAFTGACSWRKGKFEVANGGTIFLDEIGELTPSLQVKLLRFLQEYRIERVGSNRQISLDVRVIAATNRNLKEAIERGLFREDLFYRIGVVTIHLPPLRERGEDITLIAEAFLDRSRREYGKRIRGFEERALKAMKAYTWPGNVRELENKVRRAVIMAEGEYITVEDLGLPCHGGDEGEEEDSLNLRKAKERLEREYIEKALTRYNWDISKSAKALGITRQYLYEKLRRYNIKRGLD